MASTSTAPASTKRKRSAATAAPDERFAFAAEDLEDSAPTDDAAPAPTGLPAHLLPTGKKHGSPGLIYFSRVPPGMGPAQIKHLLSAYGEVGRVFLARSAKEQLVKKDKHREHRFAEGWVEFMDKKVARSVADMLNANTIGGKKGSRFRDDVWTMKYLPRFRWDMLSEQVALERATQTSLLRFHLQNTRTEQESYLQAVEKARVKVAIEDKAEWRREGKRLKGETPATGEGKEKKKERERTYRQREVVDVAKRGQDAGRSKQDLDGVLSRLF